MSHEDVRCALADGRPVSKWRNGHSPDVGTTVRTYDRDEVWYGTVMVEVCEGAPVAVSGWVLTDRHDLGPCAASSLHRVTISVIQTTKGETGRKAWPTWVHAMSPGCSARGHGNTRHSVVDRFRHNLFFYFILFIYLMKNSQRHSNVGIAMAPARTNGRSMPRVHVLHVARAHMVVLAMLHACSSCKYTGTVASGQQQNCQRLRSYVHICAHCVHS